MPMRLKELARLLDTHGADLARWPPHARPAAQSLLASSATARRLWEEARQLDAALRGGLAGPDAAAMARMQATVALAVARAPLPEQPSGGGLLRWLRPWAPAGCGALATLAACWLWLSRPEPEAAEILGAPRFLAMMENRE